VPTEGPRTDEIRFVILYRRNPAEDALRYPEADLVFRMAARATINDN